MTGHERIAKGDVEDIFELTPTQEGILFHHLRDPSGSDYQAQLSVELQGPLDFSLLGRAWKLVVAQNQMLRTVFRWHGLNRPVQMVLKRYVPSFEVVDLREAADSDQDARFCAWKRGSRARRLDIAAAPVRIAIVELTPERRQLVLTHHHIVYDGWSGGIVLAELFAAYGSLRLRGTADSRAKPPFKHFVKWLAKRDSKADAEFWRSCLAKAASWPAVEREGATEARDAPAAIELSGELRDRLSTFCRAHEVTLASVLYAALGIVLQRWRGTRDVVFGTTVSGRAADVDDVVGMVGLLINTPPLRVTTRDGQACLDLVRSVQEALRRRIPFESTPLVDIKRWAGVDPERDLFDTIIVIENYPIDRDALSRCPELTLASYEAHEQTSYPLTVVVNALVGKLEVRFAPRTKEMRSAAPWMRRSFVDVVERIVKDPARRVADMPIISQVDRDKLLSELSATATVASAHANIVEAFRAQVVAAPDRVAVSTRAGSLTYRALDERSAALARVLLCRGVEQGAIVGVCAERSIDLVIAVLGVLRAGAAYLPIHPELPLARVRAILDGSGCRFVLSQGAFASAFAGGPTVIALDGPAQQAAPASATSIELPSIQPMSLAYVLYTSGSTGVPKGVMVEHGALLNRLAWAQRRHPLGPDDVLLQKTNIMFDVSVWELLGWILGGASLHLLPPGAEGDPRELVDTIDAHKVTVVHFVPSMLQAFFDHLEARPAGRRLDSLRRVHASGEALRVAQVAQFHRLVAKGRPVQLVNLYGPTEAAVDVSFHDCPAEDAHRDAIPIGAPIDNVRLYVLDDDKHLLPIGAPGHLHIGGVAVGRGYIGAPTQTAERFIPDPFCAGARMYATGDLARWDADGELEYLGRIDYQVKLRGFRVELLEVEAVLLRHGAIKEAVAVVAPDGAGDPCLVAYVVPGGSQALDTGDVKDFVATTLPHYMVPAHVIPMDALPLAATGKVDRAALSRKLVVQSGAAGEEAPSAGGGSKLEVLVASAWSDALGVPSVDRDQRFFDLGGNSLKALRLSSRLSGVLGIELPVTAVFQHPTVSRLAEHLREMMKTEQRRRFRDIPVATRKPHYPLSSAQKRIYVLHEIHPDSTAYNGPVAYLIDGPLDVERARRAFAEIVRRHESLRTTFVRANGEPVQKIQQNVEPLVAHGRVGAAGIHGLVKDFVRPFDLTIAPLMRVGLYEIEERQHVLLVDIHHIATDGGSYERLVRDFIAFYQGDELPPLRLQYKDYSEWQHSLEAQEMMREQEAYWLEKMADRPSPTEFPLQFERPAVQSFVGDSLRFTLGKPLAAQVGAFVSAQGTTLFVALLAVFKILLQRYSGRNDLIIGSPVAGRFHPDLDQAVGMFVNMLPIRTTIDSSTTFVEHLRRVQEVALEALEHEKYQYEDLIVKLKAHGQADRNPLFNIVFVLQGKDPTEELRVGDLVVRSYDLKLRRALFDLVLSATEMDDDVLLNLDFATALFKREVLEAAMSDFRTLLADVIADPSVRISDLELASALKPAKFDERALADREFAFD